MTNTISITDVRNQTEEFFQKHWNINAKAPTWNNKYDFIGEIPQGNCPGCYALLENDNVVYIGLGASKGGGKYEEHGIGARLINHVIVWDRSIPAPVAERRFTMKEKWKEITDLYTIGFPKEYGYLASALEAYLIKELNPVRNVTGRR